EEGQFAFADIKGDINLVQITLTGGASALSPVDVKIFRHEIVTVFRYSHRTTLHPADIRILEPIEAEHTKYEEENGCVFLARHVMERLRQMTDGDRRRRAHK
ncbi:hypothetical protein PLICRDRAFT_70716, partial [Plicaturopsis crispa FD-325 SS-3]